MEENCYIFNFIGIRSTHILGGESPIKPLMTPFRGDPRVGGIEVLSSGPSWGTNTHHREGEKTCLCANTLRITHYTPYEGLISTNQNERMLVYRTGGWKRATQYYTDILINIWQI